MLYRALTIKFIPLVLLSIVLSQDQITLHKVFPVQDKGTFLPLSDHLSLVYTRTIIYHDDHEIYSSVAGIITGVEPLSEPNKVLVLTINDPGKKDPALLTCQPVSLNGNKDPSWKIDIPYDSGKPETILSNDRIFFLWPGSQTYSIYHMDGNKTGQFDLFEKSPWDHEKRLMPIYHGTDLYLLGMYSADLSFSENVHLFQIDPSFEPDHISSIPLTVPYHTSISPGKMIAIVGTRNDPASLDQDPYLSIFPLNGQASISTIRLHRLPAYLLSLQDQVILIFKDRIQAYSPYVITDPTVTLLDRTFYTQGLINTGKTVIILAAGEIIAGQTGALYSNISLLTYDTDSNSVSEQNISNNSYSKVHLTYLKDSSDLYVQLDNSVYHYKIDK